MSWGYRDAPDPAEGGADDRLVRCEQCGTDVDEGDVLHTAYGGFCGDDCASQWFDDLHRYLLSRGIGRWDAVGARR